MLEKFNNGHHNINEVKNLMGMAVGRPTGERLQNLLDVVYDYEGYQLYVNNEAAEITGIIGVDISAAPHGWILHLAILPEYRRQGKGRKLIDSVITELGLISVGLETDQDAVDFYRVCGFDIKEIYSPWPNVRRYRCIKGNPPQSVLEYYNNKRLKMRE